MEKNKTKMGFVLFFQLVSIILSISAIYIFSKQFIKNNYVVYDSIGYPVLIFALVCLLISMFIISTTK